MSHRSGAVLPETVVPGGHDHDHEHDHDHDHDHGWLGRLRHELSDLVGGHGHDTADMVDDALEADRRGRRAMVVSLAVLAVAAVIQGVVAVMSGSVALLGDTLHNAVDALTAVPLLLAFRLARRAPTKRLTYGYGRAEDLAGLVVVAMILVSAGLAAYESVGRLLHPREVTHLWAVAVAAVVGFLGNEWAARYRIGVGRRIGSAALVADGLHARTDGFTSLAVLLGAGGVALGWQRADAVIGLAITVAILGVLRSAVRQVGDRLMDAVDPALYDRAQASIMTVDEIQDVRDLRLRWIGHTLHAEADVVVSADLDLPTAHGIAHHAEEHLVAFVPRLAAATIHVSPAHVSPAHVSPAG